VTLILDLDTDAVKTYLRTKNKFVGQGIQRLEHLALTLECQKTVKIFDLETLTCAPSPEKFLILGSQYGEFL